MSQSERTIWKGSQFTKTHTIQPYIAPPFCRSILIFISLIMVAKAILINPTSSVKKLEPRRERNGRGLAHWKLYQAFDTTPPKTWWMHHLTPTEYAILRHGCAEAANSSIYYMFFPRRGYFACRACGNVLYHARDKYKSPKGLPCFSQCVPDSMALHCDTRIPRISCNRCHSHVGYARGVQPIETLQAAALLSGDDNIWHDVNGTSLMYIQDDLLSKTKNCNATSTCSFHSEQS
jgi:peptide-methionine (R)-S-oxide reductase